MIKQLPCPYCKDSWLFISKYDYGSDYENKGYQGTCKCGRFNKIVSWNKTKEQAIEEWNNIIESEADNDLIKAFELLKAHCKNRECNKDCIFFRELTIGENKDQYCALCEIVTSDDKEENT